MRNSKKALSFSLNLCFLVMAYYLVKPLSRTLFLTYIGSPYLPYVWIGTTAVLLCLIPFFHWRLNNFPPLQIMNTSCISFLLLLIFAYFALSAPSPKTVSAFYILVDVYSVVLIENFWSVTNASFRSKGDERWLGIIAGGGLVGGLAGGMLASLLLRFSFINAVDLILIAAIILLAIIGMNSAFSRNGYLPHVAPPGKPESMEEASIRPRRNRALWLIAAVLFISQLIEPLVEYQFLSRIEAELSDLESRTTFLSWFFAILNGVALLINITIVPWMVKKASIASGLALQPFSIFAASAAYFISPSLWGVSSIKIVDGALSFSVSRAFKEMLYLQFEFNLIAKAKLWIDLLAARCFKIVGSLAVLFLTRDFGLRLAAIELSWFIFAGTVIWILILVKYGRSVD
ncbi:MAG: hypothetical protein J5J00_03575 [Deltaproteobacteria bacterium]|nr:hypothetical protein [Deltaproteobacteria bacterium]